MTRAFAGATLVGLVALTPGAAGDGPIAAMRLPAPITIQIGYGHTAVAHQITTDGRLNRIAPTRSAFPPHAGWSPITGNWFVIRRHHLVVGRHRKLLWRSHGEFKRVYDMAAIQVGPQTIAFGYGNNLYMAPLTGPEQLVGRSEVPLGFTTGGLYTYQWRRRLLLRSDSGAIVTTIARRPFGSDYFLTQDGTLYFVARGWLQSADGAFVRRLVALRRLGLSPRSVALQPVGDLLELEDNNRLVMLGHNGSVFASVGARAWGGGVPSGSGVLSPRGNAVAFTASIGQSTQAVYVLREGAHRATAVYRRRAQLGCEQGSGVQWHGSWLLYNDSAGDLAAIDTAGPRRVIDLTGLVKRVMRVPTSFNAYWSGQPPEF